MKIVIILDEEDYNDYEKFCKNCLNLDSSEQIKEQIIENVLTDPYDYGIELVIGENNYAWSNR